MLAQDVFDRRWSLDGVKTLIKNISVRSLTLFTLRWYYGAQPCSDLNISVASLKSTRRRTGSQCNSCRTEQVRCVHGDLSAWLTWRQCSVQTAVVEVGWRWRRTKLGCSSPSIVWSTTTWTRVSDATFSVKCFNPLKLYLLSENIFRKWFASYFLFVYEHSIIIWSPAVNLIAVMTLLLMSGLHHC